MGIGYMAEEDEGAIWADWAEGVMGSEGAIGAEEDEGAAIYLMFDGWDTMGMAMWLYRASEQNV